jgi:NADH-quinone oxidoreductase subunit M
MYKRVIFGGVQNAAVEKLDDVNRREVLFLALLAIAVLAMGIWPAPLLDVMHVSVDELLRQASTTKIDVLTAIVR